MGFVNIGGKLVNERLVYSVKQDEEGRYRIEYGEQYDDGIEVDYAVTDHAPTQARYLPCDGGHFVTVMWPAPEGATEPKPTIFRRTLSVVAWEINAPLLDNINAKPCSAKPVLDGELPSEYWFLCDKSGCCQIHGEIFGARGLAEEVLVTWIADAEGYQSDTIAIKRFDVNSYPERGFRIEYRRDAATNRFKEHRIDLRHEGGSDQARQE